ncbi:unnamed protein product [Spirodela intermedia]|uniref:CBS domain-containing protein n=1 Tax=Spirodela intermedia TaxID=51605 RepID=A0A7I8JK13_SPIIN|nr:unnamed protein product [Spirodela intermedia]CAA6670517.1 unnamed protein product [Spirodela intermedia]
MVWSRIGLQDITVLPLRRPREGGEKAPPADEADAILRRRRSEGDGRYFLQRRYVKAGNPEQSLRRFPRPRSPRGFTFTIALPSILRLLPQLSEANNDIYRVGDFMTKREELKVVKPTTTIERALEILVESRITGFPVIDDDWTLVGVVSDYDLLALDSISGTRSDTALFPEVDSTWKTFNEIQKLLSKTNGKVIGDLMTHAPLVVRETTNLGDAARLLLETKYRRLPVVDSAGKLGHIVRAALQMKRLSDGRTLS